MDRLIKLVDQGYSEFRIYNQFQKQNFLQALEKTLSDKYGLPSCKVEIYSLAPIATSLGHSPPACFKPRPNEFPLIVFDIEKLNLYSYIKVVKLLFHEWMHYLAYYYLQKQPIAISDRYLPIIEKSDFVKKLNVRDIENKSLASSLQKLSPGEYVADLFARDIMRIIGDRALDKQLREDAKAKILSEEKKEVNHLANINKICQTSYSHPNEIEFEKIVKRSKNNVKKI